MNSEAGSRHKKVCSNLQLWFSKLYPQRTNSVTLVVTLGQANMIDGCIQILICL
jgi:hypothetical protein